MTVGANTLLSYTVEQWGAFIATHCLGAFAVAWVAGITFMLTMTISVLQLREVGVSFVTFGIYGFETASACQ